MAPYMPFLYVKDNRKVIDFCLFHKQKNKKYSHKICTARQNRWKRYYFITFAIRVIIGYFEIGENRFVL